MISTTSDHAATAGAVIRDRRPAVPAVTGIRPACWLRFPPTKRTLRLDRSGNVTARSGVRNWRDSGVKVPRERRVAVLGARSIGDPGLRDIFETPDPMQPGIPGRW